MFVKFASRPPVPRILTRDQDITCRPPGVWPQTEPDRVEPFSGRRLRSLNLIHAISTMSTSHLQFLFGRRAAVFVGLVIAQALANASPIAARPADQPQRYERALKDFREQRWAAAYARFARLADAGHRQSAELASLMHRHGRTLFGGDWSASPEQQRRWNAVVAVDAGDRRATDDLAHAE